MDVQLEIPHEIIDIFDKMLLSVDVLNLSIDVSILSTTFLFCRRGTKFVDRKNQFV